MKRKRDTNKNFVEFMHASFDSFLELSFLRMFLYMLLFYATYGLILILWATIYQFKRIVKLHREYKEDFEQLKNKYGLSNKELKKIIKEARKEYTKRARKKGGDC